MNKSNLKNVLENVLHQNLTKETYKALYNRFYWALVVNDYLKTIRFLKEDDFCLAKSSLGSLYYLIVFGHYSHYIYLNFVPGLEEKYYAK